MNCSALALVVVALAYIGLMWASADRALDGYRPAPVIVQVQR